MKGSGGTNGGLMPFLLGLGMLGLGLWMFVDSVSVGTHHRILSRYYGGSFMITMGPLVLGIFILFFNSKSKLGWLVIGIGVVLIFADVISGLRLRMHMKLWKWGVLLTFIVGGLALIAKSFLPARRND